MIDVSARHLTALLTLTVGAAALTGCSALGVKEFKPFDEVQNIEESEEGTEFDATLGVRITETEVQDPAALADLNLWDEDSEYTIPVFVTAEVTLIDGTLDPAANDILGGSSWSGRGSDGKAAEGLNVIGTFEGCSGVNEEQIAQLEADGKVEICTILLAQTDAEITEVGYGSTYWKNEG